MSKLDNSCIVKVRQLLHCQSQITPAFYFSGWKGVHCDDDIDECNLQFCQNILTCTNTDGDYTCTCLPGYTDKNCSTDIDECANKPCQNNAVCTDKVNDFDCDCNNTGKLMSDCCLTPNEQFFGYTMARVSE